MGATFRSALESTNVATTTHTADAPAGIVDGDLLLAFLAINAVPSGVPTGWAEVVREDLNSIQFLYWKKASSEPASWDWTTDANDASGFYVLAYEAGSWDDQAADPFDDFDAAQVDPADAQTLPAPSVSSNGDDRVLVTFHAPDGGSDLTGLTDYVPATGMTERAQLIHTGDNRRTGMVAEEAGIGSGATGTRDATFDGTDKGKAAGISALILPAETDDFPAWTRPQGEMVYTRR